MTENVGYIQEIRHSFTGVSAPAM